MCVSNLSVLGYIVSLLEISNMGNADPLLLVVFCLYWSELHPTSTALSNRCYNKCVLSQKKIL